MRDPMTGTIDQTGTDFAQFARYVAAMVPKAEDQQQLWQDLGLQ
jgi:hypothetical protein